MNWQRMPASDALRNASLVSVARVDDRFLGLGCVSGLEGCIQPAIWESADGLEWLLAEPVFLAPDFSGGVVGAVASSVLGMVAAGHVTEGDTTHASFWLRGADGWAQVTPQAAADATVAAVLAADGRVFAVGSGAFQAGFRAWWSADGTTWQAASSPREEFGGRPSDLFAVGDALLAWGISFGDPERTLWWRTLDGTVWQRVDAPRGLDDAYITAISRTQGGFEAFGWLGGGDLPVRSAAWIADERGADWRPVAPPQPESAAVRHRLPVGQGSVAAGNGPPGQQTGLVWLRGPGEVTWREPVIIPDFEVLALIQDPDQRDRVIVIGRTFEGLRERLVIWTGLVEWAP
jgi:hypothetical protein